MTIPLDEHLATLATLARDDAYNAQAAIAADGRGAADAVASIDEATCRASAERLWQIEERDGVADPAKRMEHRRELLARGDRYVRERILEKERKAREEYAQVFEAELAAAFKWTDDPELGASENKRRRDDALRKHIHSPVEISKAIRRVQKQRPGMLSDIPSRSALEAECRREVEAERPWLFAHLRPASQGGAQARTAAAGASERTATGGVHERARAVLARHVGARFSYSTRSTRTASAPPQVRALADELLEAYGDHEISGLATDSQDARALDLARALLALDVDRREGFLGAVMRAAGVS